MFSFAERSCVLCRTRFAYFHVTFCVNMWLLSSHWLRRVISGHVLLFLCVV